MNSKHNTPIAVIPLGAGQTFAFMVFGLLLSLPVAGAVLGSISMSPDTIGVVVSIACFCLISWLCQAAVLGLMIFLNSKVQNFEVQISELGVIVVTISTPRLNTSMHFDGQFRPPQIVS